MSDPRDPRDPALAPGGLTCDEVRDLAGAFVLGALDADEAAAVRVHLAGCSDAHAEIAEVGSVLPALDASVPLVGPPAALKGRLHAAPAADREARTATSTAAIASAAISAAATSTAASLPPEPPEPTPLPVARRSTSVGTWAVRIAAVLAIVLLGGWNLLLQSQLSASRTYEEHVAAVLDVAGQPGSLTAILSADGGEGPVGLAAVDANGAVSMAMRDLPATTGDQVYEAWVIAADGVPVALGGFRVGNDGIAYFEGDGLPTDPGIVLALTLEPAPGATVPGGPIVSSGTATARAG